MPDDLKLGEIIDSRYELLEFLGGGRVGRVYLAKDTQKNQQIALKILSAKITSEREKSLFAREFAAVKSLNHPGVVKVYEQGDNYFTMEYIKGISLADYKEKEVSSVFEIAIAISRVLDYIHRQGVIHRDLKPENIKIVEEGRVKILDFGFATCENLTVIRSGESTGIVGTLDYMAPEMIKGFEIDPRADLYSIGIIFYELVTNRLPFKSSDILTTVVKQVEALPQKPSKINKKLTPGFESIILKLIDKSPSKRYQSADELLSAMLRLAGRSEILDIRIERGQRHLKPPKFCGREHEIQRLLSIFHKAMKGRGLFALLKSEEGMGKTRVIEEFQSHLETQVALFLKASCKQHLTGTLPAFFELVKQLHEILQKSHHSFAQELFSRWGSTLQPFVPELQSANYGQNTERTLNQQELQEHLCQFFVEVSRQCPLGIFLDDLHWLEQSSCEFLLKLLQAAQDYPIFFCGSYRPHTAESRFERILPHLHLKKLCEEIEIKPLTPEQLSPFLGSMIEKDRLEGPILGKLHEVSRGVPILAVETLKNLADSGLIFRKGGNWQLDIDDLRKIVRPNLLEESLLEKYDKLDGKSVRIMQAASVIGHRFKKSLLGRVASVESTDLMEHLPELTRKGFLSQIDDGATSDFIIGSPRLAQLLYEKIPLQTKLRLHERVAKELEVQSPDNLNIESLAYHYFRTQNHPKALEYLLKAGEYCEKKYLYNNAIEYYQQAFELAKKKSDEHQQLKLLDKLGNAHLQSGQPSKAMDYYHRGIDLAKETSTDENKFYKGVAISCFKKGNFEEALNHFDVLLRNLRKNNEDVSEELSLMASVYIAVGEYNAAENLLKEALELARHKENKKLQASIYNFFAEIHFMKGQWPNAMNYYLRAFDILQSLQDNHLKARIAKGIARIFIQKGRASEAYKYIEEALYLCLLTGDREFRVTVEIDLGLLYEYEGQLSKAIEIYQESMEVAQDLGAKLPEAVAATHLSYVMNLCDKNQRALDLALQSMDIFKELKIQWGVAEASRILGEIYNSQGEYELAHKAFSLGEKAFIAIGMKWKLVSVYTGVSEVLRKLNKVELANKTLNKALRKAKKYDDDIMLGKIQTQYALFCAQNNHSQEALEHFISATVLLQRVTCALELARTYYEYARVLLDFERQGDSGFVKVAIHQLEKAKEIYRKAGIKSMLNKTLMLIKEWEREKANSLYKRDLGVKLREFGRELSEFESDSKRELQELRTSLLEDMGEDMDRAEIEKKLTLMEQNLNRQVEELREQNSKLLEHVEELKTERESLLTLQKISNTINSVLDSQKLLNLIMDMVIKELRAERGFLVLRNHDGKLKFKAARNIEKEELSISDSNLSTSIVKKVMKTSEPVLTSDAQADGRFQSESITDLKLRSILCVPFMLKDKVIGAVYVDNRFVSGLFTQHDLDFLIAFSNQAAISIENAFLYEELREKERIEQEINIAARIQAGLLPKSIPEVDGIEVYGKMIPAREVGGDYYDFIMSPDGKILSVVIGDVTGKGVPAGLVMVMARLILHHFLQETNFSTRKTMLAANRLLKDNTEPFIFMSMLVAKWDSKTSRFTYTGAGHENIIVYQSVTDTLEIVPAGGVVLGVKDTIEDLLEQKELHLEKDDKIILYTDGVTESISPSGDMLELDGFMEILLKHRQKRPKEMIDSILKELAEFMGDQEQHDDITLTVLQKL